MASITLVVLIQGGAVPIIPILTHGAIEVFKEGFSLLFWVMLIRAILSFISQGHNPLEAVLHQLTEPMLAPIRRVVPPIGGLDLSMLVLIIGLQFLMKLADQALRALF